MDPSATMQRSIQRVGRHAPGDETQEIDTVGGQRRAARHGASTESPRGAPGNVCRGGVHWKGRDGSGPGRGFGKGWTLRPYRSIECIMEETEAAEAPSSHTGVREFQTDPSMLEAPAEEPAVVLMKPTPKIKSKEKGKAMRPVRNLLPDHVDQSTMGVDPREPSGPAPGSSAPACIRRKLSLKGPRAVASILSNPRRTRLLHHHRRPGPGLAGAAAVVSSGSAEETCSVPVQPFAHQMGFGDILLAQEAIQRHRRVWWVAVPGACAVHAPPNRRAIHVIHPVDAQRRFPLRVKDHAQLPVSLIPPKATSDLSSTVMRMAETMETGDAGTLIPAGRPFNTMSLRA